MRSVVSPRIQKRKAVEVDYSNVKEQDNVFWFRPSECFANVIVPVFMLNDRQSGPRDRFQIIMNSYHAAIYDTSENILYDPTIDCLEQLGAAYEGDEKKLSTLGLFMTSDALSIRNNQLYVATLSLSEFLIQSVSGSSGQPLIKTFNEALGREAIKENAVGSDLKRLF